MAAKNNLIKTADIQVTAREIDFVTRFERNWEHLREILGIMRPIKKQPGAILKSKYAEGALADGNVGEGEEIPYSKFTVKEKEYAEMTIEKYAKAVSIEAIKDHGYENAVQMTDDEFLFQLQSNVTERFYTYLNTGTLTGTETTFQMALAMAKGMVISIHSTTRVETAILHNNHYYSSTHFHKQIISHPLKSRPTIPAHSQIRSHCANFPVRISP